MRQKSATQAEGVGRFERCSSDEDIVLGCFTRVVWMMLWKML